MNRIIVDPPAQKNKLKAGSIVQSTLGVWYMLTSKAESTLWRGVHLKLGVHSTCALDESQIERVLQPGEQLTLEVEE